MRETLLYTALLRLGREMSWDEKRARAEEVMQEVRRRLPRRRHSQLFLSHPGPFALLRHSGLHATCLCVCAARMHT